MDFVHTAQAPVISGYIESPPQFLILRGMKGGQQEIVGKYLASKWTHGAPGLLHQLKPHEGTITATMVKEMISVLSHSRYSSEWLVFAIYQADTMTKTAQNSLLKILEDMPRRMSVIMTVSSNNLLKTIRSRASIIELLELTEGHFTDVLSKARLSGPEARQLYHMTMGRAGKAMELAQDSELLTQQQERLQAAKHFISSSKYMRLVELRNIRDRKGASEHIDDLIIVCRTMFNLHLKDKSRDDAVQWIDRLGKLLYAKDKINSNISSKLVLDYLAVAL